MPVTPVENPRPPKTEPCGIESAASHPTDVDEVDYEQAVALHHEDLHRFALSLARNPEEARDLTEESYCRLLSKSAQLRDRTKVKSWLFTTLYRVFLGWKRHEKRFPHFEFSAAESQLPALTADAVDRMDGAVVMAALIGASDFVLPVSLADKGIAACKIVAWQGSQVTMLCLKFGGRHLDVFVVNASDLPGVSLGSAPKFFADAGATTAAWRRDGNIYVVAGTMPKSDLQPLL